MTPTSEAELAELIATASGPFSIVGGGSRLLDHGEGNPLHTRALSGISLYEPGALTMVAQAGTSLEEIEAALKSENQRLAFEPPDLRDVLGTTGKSTIGGVVSSNASGPRRIAVGACRDFMLGVRFVDGLGRVVKNGGRVMKNVTGYDLVKLMCGAHGTLGVLSEVSMKVLPDVEMQATLHLKTASAAEAVTIMSAALGSPYEVTGAARDIEGNTLLRLEGFEVSVRYRAAQLRKHLNAQCEVTLIDEPAQNQTLWRDIRDARALSEAGDLWRISVKPSDAPHVLSRIDPQKALLDWGGGLIWALMPEGSDLRAKLDVAGHATLMRAGADSFASLARFHPEPAPIRQISAGLRAQFDPKRLLNPGRMGDVQ